MAEQIDDQAEEAPAPVPLAGKASKRRIARWIGIALAVLVAVAVAIAWFSRERLANDFITSQLEALGVDATYTIESIGPRQQVLTDIVVGDAARPDLTIERVVVAIEPRWPFIGLEGVTLTRPRLYGSYREGKLSFGALDKILFPEEESKEPFTLPDMRLDLVDGRALLESDYGPVGIKADGRGNLRTGFEGILAANAPKLEIAGCTATAATLYGKATILGARPGFAGPLRLRSLDCPDQAMNLGSSALELDALMDPDLKGVEGETTLTGNTLSYAGNRIGKLAGTAKLTWRRQTLIGQYDLDGQDVESSQFALARLGLEGTVRTARGFDQIEVQADAAGSGLRTGSGLDTALRNGVTATSGTLLGPMLAQLRGALAREQRDSTLAANLTLRKTGDAISVVMPQARVTGGSGDTLLALSRVQFTQDAEGSPRFSGNLATGGAGIPRISGRMEGQGGASDTILRLRMAEYRAGGGSLEIPELLVAQGPGGSIGFSGSARASGALPGGSTRGLAIPLRGNWSPRGGLSLWRECTAITFRELTIASLTLDGRSLRLCPPTGQAIVRQDVRGLRIAAGAPTLDLSGRLGETRIHMKSGAVGLAWPGVLNARDVDIELGVVEAPARFRLSEINARIDSEVGGSFAGAEASLFSVPLDLQEAGGDWRYADGVLSLTGGAFRLVDRQQPGRFEPLIARDATLSLADNIVTAQALLREPASDREVLVADIVHNLNDAVGHADLAVNSLVFDEQLQPDKLTGLALGIVANAFGTVTGQGRIDWNAQTVASTGRFSTGDLDFAAAFGPVEGVSGTIEFTDLLGMVTAPNQILSIETFNPGIAVDRGELNFELRENFVVLVHGGRWPFIGGTLIMEPAQVRMAEPEARSFTLRLEGVDAAQFVERMGLANLQATGKFDGTVPLIFDDKGGRIEGGRLLSRAPGGNVAYVGALTYEDLHPIANFAFDALKSLDYREMEIMLDGSLTGEIVTRVKFDGVRQGAGTTSNIFTRQLARLPLQFNVNIHAPFYRLIGTFKAMYDPAYIRDPRELGLIDAEGNPVENPGPPPLPDGIKPEDMPADEPVIQPLESENAP